MLNGFGDAAEIEAVRAGLAQEFGVKAVYCPADMSKPAEVAGMIDRAARFVPALAELPVRRAWCGFRPWLPDGLPAVGPLRRDGHLRHDDIVLLHHPRDREVRAADERRILDLRVVGLLADEVEAAEDRPLDVVGEARQDLRVVGPPEPLDVALDDALPVAHGWVETA